MDLIFTNANKIDQGVLHSYSMDLSFGEDSSENDFELTLSNTEPALEDNSMIYMDGTEYGGIVDGMRSNTESQSTIYVGRTWHGIMNSKVIEPDSGEDYLIVSGDANSVLASLIDRLGLSGMFSAVASSSGINIANYQFPRYCMGYDGIRAMLEANGAKLKIRWENRCVMVSAEPAADYTDSPVDGDVAPITLERCGNKVNHLVCLGRGELAKREVLHLYVDQFGRIGTTQVYTGMDEVTEIYDYRGVESLEELRKGGIERLAELRGNDKIEVSINEDSGLVYDVTDIISAKDNRTGNTATARIIQKIVKIKNGTINIEYLTGGQTVTATGSSLSGGGDGGGGSDYDDTTGELPIATSATLGAIKVGNNLAITEDGTLSVNTTNQMEQDNTLPITSAGVYATVGNIEVLLKTI